MIRYVLKTLGSFRSALVVGVGLPFLIASAYAQEATTERVIVTGSYIPTAETESALPVTVYTAEVLQKQGANTPVEGLRQLPSFVGNAATENDSNGGDGSASINLRGIGSANTLVEVVTLTAVTGGLYINYQGNTSS
jgi:outer membrane receptor for ferrienterochelin and colicin